MYQALARKYRPQNFDEVVGQEHVTTTLKNSIQLKRIHHAYVFTGVRGTGKTSLARIFAKSLNCEQGPTISPCGVCSNCQSAQEGRALDIFEIDGASNTSVDSVRELREEAKYLPASGKYKIYIIDEVHMLSTSAFNALLKILEEPPPHVIFIFATTEVQKIPLTILSRCQRFDLHRLSIPEILQRLEKICSAEKIQYDSLSLETLAKSAEGSLRDAQTLLDTAIGLCGEKLASASIQEMLGLVEGVYLEQLTQNVLRGNLPDALATVQKLYENGRDLNLFAKQWLEYLYQITVWKACETQDADEAAVFFGSEEFKLLLKDQDLATFQILFQTAYLATEQISRSEMPKILFDLLIIKMIHGSPFQALTEIIQDFQNSAPSQGPSISAKPKAENNRTPAISRTISETQAHEARPQTREEKIYSPQFESPRPDANATHAKPELEKVLKKYPQIRAILDHALAQTWEQDSFIIDFEKGSLWGEMLQEKRELLAQALSENCQKLIRVQVRELAKAKEKVAETPLAATTSQDPIINSALKILNATIKEVKNHGHE